MEVLVTFPLVRPGLPGLPGREFLKGKGLPGLAGRAELFAEPGRALLANSARDRVGVEAACHLCCRFSADCGLRFDEIKDPTIGVLAARAVRDCAL